MVIWVTGLSSSGKTTLCNALWDIVKPRLPELVLLDGDVVRAAFGHNLGHSEADRIEQVHRLQSISRVLAEQGLLVVVGAVYSNPELLAWNRENLADYFEVYLHASLETVSRRDAKGLYADARNGTVSNVVGIDIPWYPPANPDMQIDEDNALAPDRLAWKLALKVPRLRACLPEVEEQNGNE